MFPYSTQNSPQTNHIKLPNLKWTIRLTSPFYSLSTDILFASWIDNAARRMSHGIRRIWGTSLKGITPEHQRLSVLTASWRPLSAASTVVYYSCVLAASHFHSTCGIPEVYAEPVQLLPCSRRTGKTRRGSHLGSRRVNISAQEHPPRNSDGNLRGYSTEHRKLPRGNLRRARCIVNGLLGETNWLRLSVRW